MFETHEDDGADDRAIERADAAEHEHHERVRGQLEADAVEPDHLRRDRRERTAHPGDEAGNHEHLEEVRRHEGAHGADADRVLLDAPAQHAEWRRNDEFQRDEDAHQQHDAQQIGGAPPEVELEDAEKRSDDEPCQAVAAARVGRRLVGRLVKELDDGDRQARVARGHGRAA